MHVWEDIRPWGVLHCPHSQKHHQHYFSFFSSSMCVLVRTRTRVRMCAHACTCNTQNNYCVCGSGESGCLLQVKLLPPLVYCCEGRGPSFPSQLPDPGILQNNWALCQLLPVPGVPGVPRYPNGKKGKPAAYGCGLLPLPDLLVSGQRTWPSEASVRQTVPGSIGMH